VDSDKEVQPVHGVEIHLIPQREVIAVVVLTEVTRRPDPRCPFCGGDAAWADDPDSLLVGGHGADGFEDQVRAMPAYQFADLRDAFLATRGDDIGGSDLPAEVGAGVVVSQEGDLFGAEVFGRQYRQQLDIRAGAPSVDRPEGLSATIRPGPACPLSRSAECDDNAAMSTSEPITVLSEDESWNLLSSVALGRYVTSLGSGRLEIFPVNFVVQKRTVLFRTAEGTKLFGAVAHNQVLFEADNHKVDGGWSVIVRGTARVLYGSTELDEAERAGLHPWTATEKLRFVRIRPTEITGRRFVFGLEPDRGWVHG